MGNPRVYKVLKDERVRELSEFQCINNVSDVSDELLSVIKLKTVTLGGLNLDDDYGLPDLALPIEEEHENIGV